MNKSIQGVLPGWWRSMNGRARTRLVHRAALVCLAIQLLIAAARLAGGESLAALAGQGTFLLLLAPLLFIRFDDEPQP